MLPSSASCSRTASYWSCWTSALRMPVTTTWSKGVALRLGEGPDAQPRVVRGEVARRLRQPPPGDDEDEQALLGEVARGVPEEGVLRALLVVVGVAVVGRVQEEHPERPVGDRRLEEVRAERVAEALLRLLSTLRVELHPVGLDGCAVGRSMQAASCASASPAPQQGSRMRSVVSPRVTVRACARLAIISTTRGGVG